jgi:hypothetical protein
MRSEPNSQMTQSLIKAAETQKGAAPAEVTTVKTNLIVTLNTIFTMYAATFTVESPEFICGQVFLTAPGGPEREIIIATLSDIVPSRGCLGLHTRSQSLSPSRGCFGVYKIRFRGYHCNGTQSGIAVAITPSILILADGNVLFESPYPLLHGEGFVDDSWQFCFKS